MTNTVKRTISGVVFTLIMIAGLLLNKFLFAALVMIMMALMMSEFYMITLKKSLIRSRLFAILSGETLFILVFLITAFDLNIKILYLAIVPFLLLMIDAVFIRKDEDFAKLSHIFTAILYIAIPMACSSLLVFRDSSFDGRLLLAFFILIWTSDVGAFVFGVSLGQRYGAKLCPNISPKKSWVGFWGGLFSTILVAVLLHFLHFTEYALYHCVALAIIIDITGVFGDLFESKWKRLYNIKDSGNVIPGHGGMLDRFDSTLFAIPASVIYMLIVDLI